MFYKKISLFTLSFLIAAMSLTGCSTAEADSPVVTAENDISSQEEKTASSDDKSLNIVCTIFPEYDWVKEILGSHAENDTVTYLLDNGVDLHSYQPTASDMAKIAQCDLFIYVGGESDAWVEDALAEAVNPDMQVINLMEVMGDSAKLEELKEGMQEDEHEHSHEHNTTFEDDEVKDRELSEWNGKWQSAYPLLLDGSLDEVWEHKAEEDDSLTAEDYKNKYTHAYETDVMTIEINAPEITYITEDSQITAEYAYSGYYIRTKDDGSKQVRYKFEKSGGDDSASQYIVFSDHNIEPSEPEHFHLYSGNDGFDTLVEEGTHFPTYYPASLSAEDIVNEMTGGESHSHEESEEEYDEHVWLSLKNAKLLCAEITNKLCILDTDSSEDYKNNLTVYAEQLDKLDNAFQALADSASVKTLIFGDKFPFRYFVDDYGLDYYAAFVGCSAESEASFETVIFLADKMNELGVSAIFTIENSDQKIAKTIVENTNDKNQRIAVLNSLQSVNSQQIADGTNYLALMQENYDVLKNALQ
ncbi:MAG: ZinT/AdcA family metal-binding protein [Oscillospiraceae bacterium]|nr:ZinT/AdcA family metal-binding protein [Oscillospiraceae bacterium]